MTIFLVRHAHAQDRASWTDDDILRPISDRGRQQSLRIANALAGEHVSAIRSSPSLRCLQTMGPLARTTAVAIVSEPRLAEGSTADDAVALVKDLTGAVAALCSHGDVIPALLDLLREWGVPLTGRGCEKGSIWRLERRQDEIVRGTYLGRPG